MHSNFLFIKRTIFYRYYYKYFFFFIRSGHRRGFDATTDEGAQLRGRNAARFARNRRPYYKIQTVFGQTRIAGLAGVFRLGTVLEKRIHGRQQQQYQST